MSDVGDMKIIRKIKEIRERTVTPERKLPWY